MRICILQILHALVLYLQLKKINYKSLRCCGLDPIPVLQQPRLAVQMLRLLALCIVLQLSRSNYVMEYCGIKIRPSICYVANWKRGSALGESAG